MSKMNQVKQVWDHQRTWETLSRKKRSSLCCPSLSRLPKPLQNKHCRRWWLSFWWSFWWLLLNPWLFVPKKLNNITRQRISFSHQRLHLMVSPVSLHYFLHFSKMLLTSKQFLLKRKSWSTVLSFANLSVMLSLVSWVKSCKESHSNRCKLRRSNDRESILVTIQTKSHTKWCRNRFQETKYRLILSQWSFSLSFSSLSSLTSRGICLKCYLIIVWTRHFV